MIRRLRGLLRKPSRAMIGQRRPTRQLTHETLEDRWLLATGPLISEFMAVNDSTLLDEDGEFSDWIEIHNPTDAIVDLTGWHLTDDVTELDKWTFTSLSLDPGEFQIVFASGKDRTNPISELHTNFSLAASGEYLALVQPDLTPAHAYAPAYPQQESDLSYGVIFDGFQFISEGAPVEVHVPLDGSLGMTWTDPLFIVNEESWIDGATGVGFGLSVPGFTVDYYKANITVDSLGDAESVIANTSQQSSTATEIAPVINYLNTNGSAHYGGDAPFPTQTIGNDVDDFVIEANATVIIPAAGQWTFGVNSDDGFSLDLDNGTDSFSMSYPNPRAPGDTLSTFNITQPGPYDLRLVMYERGGGAEVEMYAAQGSYGSWNGTNFDLVGDTGSGGLEVFTSPNGGAGGSTVVRTDIESTMLGVNSSAYLRVPFTVTDAAELDSLSLEMKYNDGFVAYLNEAEIVRRNAPANASWNSSATSARSQQDTLVAEVINLSGSLGLLTNGLNVLSIHGLNVTASNDTFLISPELVGGGVLASDPLYFAAPTPGTINSTASFGIVADTTFSVDRGFYDAPFQVEITSDTVGATIRYTTDGSEPTDTHGTVYSGPIDITTTTALRAAAFKPGFQSTNVDTQTYVFVNDVIGQSNSPAGFPSSWGGTSADYGMDPDITNNPAYAATLSDDLKSLPVMSITMDVDDLFGSSGIYSNSNSQGVAWERPASLEYFDPNSTDDFQENAGIRMYGGVGRNAQYKKHSFRLLFKGQYGATKLRFPLFGNDAADRFDTIILRSNFNDAWVWGGNETQFVRDEFAGRLQLAMGEPGRHGDFVHLYVNGLYWGLYNPVERPDTSFSATYFGGDKENWDGINSGNPTGESQTAAWNTLMNMASGLGSNTEYQRVQGKNLDGTDNPAFEDYLDIDNYITYLLVNFYGGNNDWVTHNWYAGRLRGPESGGFKSYSWDAEWIVDMRSGLNDNAVNDTTTNNHLLKPYTYLRNNAEFRLRFADHVHKHMFNDGVLTPAATSALYQSLVDLIEAAVVAESARWGDVVSATPFTPQDWTSERDYLLNTYLPQRSSIVFQQLRNAGLYPDIVAPTLNVNGLALHGGIIQQGDSLTITAPSGTIYYTTDGSDPRALYGGISPAAQVYAGGIPLNEAVRIRARVLSGGEWSAVADAIFILDTPPPLRITEIMYNPAPADVASGELNVDNDRFEFIELKNVGPDLIDLTDLRFTNGIDFDFATSDIPTISPGQHVVVARDLAAFQSRYGTSIPVAGEFANDTALRNSGEQIRLESALGQVFHDFEYNDTWYPNTDGGGYSLTILDENSSVVNWDKQEGWRPSAAYNGSPGTDDNALAPGSVVINEVLTHTDLAGGDWIELLNTTGSPIDIGGWFISDSASELTKYQIAAGTIINSGQYLVFTSSNHFGNAADAGANTLFGFSELGEEAHVSSLDPTTGGPGSYRVMVEFAGADQEVSFGRLQNSAGYEDLVSTTVPTQGTANALPVVPELILNEIMYHPALGQDEYIELYNRGTVPVALYDPANPANTWRFTNGVMFDFPTGVTVAAGEHILVVPIDPETFRMSHGLSAGVQIFGPYVGALENAGEVLELSRPGVPDSPPNSAVPYIVNERVRFNDRAPWPVTADGNGPSLARAVVDQWGNDPANWSAGTNGGTPGAANLFTDATPPSAPGGLNATVGVSGLFELNWIAAVDAQSGIGLYHIYRDGVDIGTSTTTNFTDGSINFTAPHTYEVSAENGDGLEGPRSAPLTTQVTGFQNGMLPNGAYAGANDTELREANPTSNQGNDTNLEIDGDDSGVDLWALLKWQLTGIPANATILGASLTLNVTNPSSGPYSVFEMKRDWVESEATWQQYRNGQSWQASGGQGSNDRGTTPIGTMNFGSTGQQTINLSAEGLTLLQDWITGAKPNYGFILGNTSNTDGLDFNSREVASAGDRPKLSISYVTGTGAAPTVNDQSFAVDENSVAGSSVGTVVATDPDAGDTLTYAITGGTGATAFDINRHSGAITVANANQLDFEANASFSLTIRVTDSGGLSDSGTMTVNLNDVNETPALSNQTFEIDENRANGTVVGTVAAQDPDAGDSLSYTIIGGTGASVFNVNSNTGQVTVANASQLDHETSGSFTLTVRATDSGNLSDTAVVTIDVDDVNEAPTISNQTLSVDENSAVGTSLGTVVATDQDAGDSLSYTVIGGTGASAFDVNINTGQVTVADASQLDHETTASFTLTVRVSDSGSLSDTAVVTVSVNDVNETPELSAQTFAINENLTNGTAVGIVLASDPDAGDALTYAITGGTGALTFNINANSGSITVANANQLDFEANPSFTLTVRVTDSGNLVDSDTITVNLNDVNEIPAVNNQTFTLFEHSANGTLVGTIAGADPDEGDTLSYGITGGSGASVFQIDGNSGDITVVDSEQLDFETNPSFGLIVRVTDAGMLFDTGTVTINLIDQAEPPADFNRDGQIDCQDVNALVSEIVSGTNSTSFDLTNDGRVDRDDLASWLEQAGAANLPSGNAYLPGDANLDGDVDGVDFGIWRGNRFTNIASWCAGDFNTDGAVDAADFNIWNEHRFMSALGVAAAVANEPRNDAPRVPRAPLAGQKLSPPDRALPISSRLWRVLGTSMPNRNEVTIDGWPQVDYNVILDATGNSRVLRLDSLFAQIGRTEVVPKVKSGELLDSFWNELSADLSFISR